MSTPLTYTIASAPDREALVAELWFGDAMWGELSEQHGRVAIELYPHPSGDAWSFDLEELRSILDEARQRLLALGADG